MVLDLTLEAGETRDLVLEVGDETLGPAIPDPEVCWQATEAAWDEAVPELEGPLLARRDSQASLVVLSGLTSSRGGMVVAATMSLPERAEQGRDYDYRYSWIRDQCYAWPGGGPSRPATSPRLVGKVRLGAPHGRRTTTQTCLHRQRRAGARRALDAPAGRVSGWDRQVRQLGQQAVPARRLR